MEVFREWKDSVNPRMTRPTNITKNSWNYYFAESGPKISPQSWPRYAKKIGSFNAMFYLEIFIELCRYQNQKMEPEDIQNGALYLRGNVTCDFLQAKNLTSTYSTRSKLINFDFFAFWNCWIVVIWLEGVVTCHCCKNMSCFVQCGQSALDWCSSLILIWFFPMKLHKH